LGNIKNMNDDYDKINWREKLRKAPEKIREAILSINSDSIFEEIVKENGLHIDQSGILAKEIDMVMLGLSPINEFLGRIEEKLNISQEQAAKITRSVNQKMFSVIREYLKSSTTKKESESINRTLEVRQPQQQMSSSEDLDRDQILKEIEGDSVPEERPINKISVDTSANNIPIPQDLGSGNKDFLRGNVEETNENPKTENQSEFINTPEEKLSEKTELFEDKLSQPVSITSERKESVENTDTENYGGRVDPYRESVE
jgi:hypothetical protein